MLRVYVVVLFLCGQLSTATASSLTAVQSADPDSLIQSVIDQTSLDSLMRQVDGLSGEDSVDIDGTMVLIRSRDASHLHNEFAADYIFQTLRSYGLPTYSQLFSTTGRNVYGVKTGTDYPDKKVIICAHYDDRPYDPGPGADDNASGTAAVLEAARILSKIPTRYTVLFMLWDMEEVGLVGSGYYAREAYNAGDEIVAVVNLDMLAWDGNGDGLCEVHTAPVAYSEQLAELALALENDHDLGLNPVVFNPGATASDHAQFWSYGYSAVLLIEGYRSADFNPRYHTSNDRSVYFNTSYFHAMARLAVATVAHLALYDFPEGPVVIPPPAYALAQNYPNPFNPSTTIAYDLRRDSQVRLALYNVLGQEVALLVDEAQSAGSKSVEFNAAGLPSGMYLYRLTAGNFVDAKKLVVLK